jgi:flagella basal body P-ring formation protein FlgA
MFARTLLKVTAVLVALFVLTGAALGQSASASAHAPTLIRVPVAARALPRGTVLGDNDILFVEREPASRTPTLASEVATGWVTRRLIKVGETLREPAVERPTVINANQSVEIIWTDGTITLSLRGIAARKGAAGERIPVRTADGRRFDAVVVSPGRVRID